jgi:hypothetical protein
LRKKTVKVGIYGFKGIRGFGGVNPGFVRFGDLSRFWGLGSYSPVWYEE